MVCNAWTGHLSLRVLEQRLRHGQHTMAISVASRRARLAAFDDAQSSRSCCSSYHSSYDSPISSRIRDEHGARGAHFGAICSSQPSQGDHIRCRVNARSDVKAYL
jgi:hypothetical protein